jgi:hypothetical protein
VREAMRRGSIPFAVLAMTAASGVEAQTLKPGLWEINSRMQMGANLDKELAQMQQQMATLPPEQRKKMEDMMARQGLAMGSGGSPGVMSVRICMTREMAERDQIPATQGDCTHTVSPRSGNTMKFAFTCRNPASSGEGQTTFLGPEAYSTKMTVNTSAQGKTEKSSMEANGRWLSSDCGAVKPLPLPSR